MRLVRIFLQRHGRRSSPLLWNKSFPVLRNRAVNIFLQVNFSIPAENRDAESTTEHLQWFQGCLTFLYLLYVARWPYDHKWPFWPNLAIYGHLENTRVLLVWECSDSDLQEWRRKAGLQHSWVAVLSGKGATNWYFQKKMPNGQFWGTLIFTSVYDDDIFLHT